MKKLYDVKVIPEEYCLKVKGTITPVYATRYTEYDISKMTPECQRIFKEILKEVVDELNQEILEEYERERI